MAKLDLSFGTPVLGIIEKAMDIWLAVGLAQGLRNFLAQAGVLGQLALAIVVAEVADSIPDEEEVANGK